MLRRIDAMHVMGDLRSLPNVALHWQLYAHFFSSPLPTMICSSSSLFVDAPGETPKIALSLDPYDRDWRSSMNKGRRVPTQYAISRKEIIDTEFVFD